MKNEYEVGVASLPRDEETGFIDRRKILHMCARLGFRFDDLYDVSAYEFVTLYEGKLLAEREMYEHLGNVVYASTAQIFSKKPYQNPYQDDGKGNHVKKKHVASKEAQQETFKTMQELFGVATPEVDDTEDDE